MITSPEKEISSANYYSSRSGLFAQALRNGGAALTTKPPGTDTKKIMHVFHKAHKATGYCYKTRNACIPQKVFTKVANKKSYMSFVQNQDRSQGRSQASDRSQDRSQAFARLLGAWKNDVRGAHGRKPVHRSMHPRAKALSNTLSLS